MTNKTALALLTAGVIAAASAVTATARVLPHTGATAVVDLSAKEGKDKNKNKNKSGQQQKNIQKKGLRGGQPNKNFGSKGGIQKQKSGAPSAPSQKQFSGPKSGSQKQKFGGQGGQPPQQIGSPTSGKKNQKYGGSKSGNQQVGGQGNKGPNKNVKVYKPKGGKNYNAVTAKELHGLPSGSSRAYVHGRNYSAWRGSHGYRIRYHDRWRTFVPLSALAVLLVGQRPFFPYAYIAAPEYYCFGRTEDGCVLNWEEVETLEGDLIGQCVAYCPWEPY